jgi:hypothetical protein
MFDTLDEGQYTEHRQELLGLLQGSVWRQLQIPPDVHNAVFAWVHYRQVCWPALAWEGNEYEHQSQTVLCEYAHVEFSI